jgi:lipopolysaccharide transport system ATP-binding protein
MNPAIRVESLSKRFHIGTRANRSYETMRETIVRGAAASWRGLSRLVTQRGPKRHNAEPKGEPDTLWALKDISFDVQSGEVLGLIGRNGAGKSTLLKIVSRITEPSSGRVRLRGRVGSLLEVGTGFHSELTGRENIYLNGAILGMSRQEIRRQFDDIVSFAEVSKHLDTPVKRYSSGMYMRLAFAVASHLNPDILLVDEVLAVGDQAFQKKCLGRMGEIGRSGRTVLFVSHNMATVMSLCDHILVLDRGAVVFAGDARRGVELYSSQNSSSRGGEVELSNHPHRGAGSAAILRKVRLLNAGGCVTDQFLCGEPITVELIAAPVGGHTELHFGIQVDDSLGRRLFTVGTYLSDSGVRLVNCPKRIRCQVNELPLAPGRYRVSLHAGPWSNADQETIDEAIWFDVNPSDFYRNGRLPRSLRGPFLVRSQWQDEDYE